MHEGNRFFFYIEDIKVPFAQIFRIFENIGTVFLHLGAVHKLFRLSEGRGGQKLLILHSKKTTKRGEGVKNRQFWDDKVYGRPLILFQPVQGDQIMPTTLSQLPHPPLDFQTFLRT